MGETFIMVKKLPLIFPLAKSLTSYFPSLQKKLNISGINKTSEEFLQGVLISSLSASVAISLVFLLIFYTFQIPIYYSLFILLIMFVFSFYNTLHIPDIRLLKKKREIEYDLVYGIRQLIIEVNSGVPLFDAMVSLTKGYGQLSKEMKKIVERTTLGEPLSLVLKDEAEKTPSLAFKRVLLQIANETVSGADVASSLSALIDQIVKDQIIEVKEYGHKLNPIVMFYLVMGVIFPTLGITFIIILLSFVSNGLVIPFLYLVLLAFLIGLFQLMFLGFVETSRPRYAMLV